MTDYPTVDYPTIIEGRIYSLVLRFECLDGSEMFYAPTEIPGATFLPKEMCWELKNFGPIDYAGKTWGVTHQQKQSKRGWLRVNPDCHHWWYFFRAQKQSADGSWIPGSEFGKYLRWGTWRWDVPGTNGKHWIGPGSYYLNFSTHWD